MNRNGIRKVIALLNIGRFFLHYLVYLRFKELVDKDLICCHNGQKELLYQLTFNKDFRNLFYKRVGLWGYILNVFAPKQNDFFINSKMPLGEGCHLEHVHCTHLNAKSIGKNFYCFHQVTIGDSIFPPGTPTIGDNVMVCCGASILGDIMIGNNVVVAAGAVVVDSVPDNCIGGYQQG